MKKLKLNDIWKISENIKSIDISFYDDKSIESIGLYSNIEQDEEVGMLYASILNIDTFPKCPEDTHYLIIKRPIDMTKYIGKLCAFWDYDYQKENCDFRFGILKKVRYSGTAYNRFTNANNHCDYDYCIPAKEALLFIKSKLKEQGES